MVLAGITFYSVVLFLHVAAVVVAFGVIFAYPIFWRAARTDARSLPYLLRTQSRIGKAVIAPGILLIIAAGIYLVADNPVIDLGESWVGVGLLVAVVLFLAGPLYFSPTEARLAELAERDIAAAGAGEVELSDEFRDGFAQLQLMARLASLAVLVALFFMIVKP